MVTYFIIINIFSCHGQVAKIFDLYAKVMGLCPAKLKKRLLVEEGYRDQPP